jgi:hypothetical protein
MKELRGNEAAEPAALTGIPNVWHYGEAHVGRVAHIGWLRKCLPCVRTTLVLGYRLQINGPLLRNSCHTLAKQNPLLSSANMQYPHHVSTSERHIPLDVQYVTFSGIHNPL